MPGAPEAVLLGDRRHPGGFGAGPLQASMDTL